MGLGCDDTHPSEFVPSVWIRDVNFDDSSIESAEGIVQSPRIMGQSTRVDDDRIMVTACAMNGLDEVTLMVGLEILDVRADKGGGTAHDIYVVLERGVPVHLGFALTE